MTNVNSKTFIPESPKSSAMNKRYNVPFKVCFDKIELQGMGYFPSNHDMDGELDLRNMPCAVLVHQWSVLGGQGVLMSDLAMTLANSQHIPTFIFDMRGVGKSTGSCSITGVSEIEDVVQVCKHLVNQFKTNNLYLVGSSAGASIAGSAIDSMDEIRAYVGIGYTFGFLTAYIFGSHFNNILNSVKSKLFIMGNKDAFTRVSTLEKYVKQMKGENEVFIVDGVGHFGLEGSNYDSILVEQIGEFILRQHHHPSCQLKRRGSMLSPGEDHQISSAELISSMSMELDADTVL